MNGKSRYTKDMTQAFVREIEQFFPTVPVGMIKQDMGSEGATFLVADAIASYHGGLAVVWDKYNPGNWEVYAPTSYDLATHCGESVPTVWGFRTVPFNPPEFGRYDYDPKKGALVRAVPSINLLIGQHASRFAESFFAVAKKAHEVQQRLAELRDFCENYVVNPERWSVDDSVITFAHPQFTLQTDFRQVIPLGSPESGIDGGVSTASMPGVFKHFYDIKPVGQSGVTTLEEAIALFDS